MIDRKYRLHGPLVAASSNPGAVSTRFGGVARNVAENLARLGCEVALAAAIGRDAAGEALAAHLAGLGIDTSRLIQMPDAATSEYAAILAAESHELILAVAAMDKAEAAIRASLPEILVSIPEGAVVFADCNLSADCLASVFARRRQGGFRLALDCVSVNKAKRLPQDLSGVDWLFLNRDEAATYLGASNAPEAMAGALRRCGAETVFLTGGAEGLVGADAQGAFTVSGLAAKVEDGTGAGDSLIAATLWRLAMGDAPAIASGMGVLAATLTIESMESVRPEMSADFLQGQQWRRAG